MKNIETKKEVFKKEENKILKEIEWTKVISKEFKFENLSDEQKKKVRDLIKEISNIEGLNKSIKKKLKDFLEPWKLESIVIIISGEGKRETLGEIISLLGPEWEWLRITFYGDKNYTVLFDQLKNKNLIANGKTERLENNAVSDAIYNLLDFLTKNIVPNLPAWK